MESSKYKELEEVTCESEGEKSEYQLWDKQLKEK